MAGLSNFAEDQILEGYFGAAAISLPATLYMALSSTAPADDGTNVSEPVGNNYARKAVSNIPGNWTAPAGTGQTDNVNDVVFNQATGGAWGIMTHLAIFDAPAGGNMLWSGALLAAKTINNGDQYKFPSNQLIAQLD